MVKTKLAARRERQQRDVPRLLDRSRDPPLVGSANPAQPPGDDLAALRHKLPQQAHVLVIDGVNLFDAELADFLAPEKFAAGIAATAARARTTRWTAAGIRTASAFTPLIASTASTLVSARRTSRGPRCGR